jgi:hypothetical protein
LKSGRSPAFSFTSAAKNSTAEMTCATTFAIAEPSRPSPAPYTRTGHSTAEIALPASTYRNGFAVSCTPRIQPLPAMVTRISGAPNSAIRSQDTAATAISSLPERTRAIGQASSCPATSTKSPTNSASHVACTPSRTASARRPAPCRRAVREVVPYDRNVSCPATWASTTPPSASPASDSASRWPTTAVSTSTYSGSAASTPSAGTARPSTRFAGTRSVSSTFATNGL